MFTCLCSGLLQEARVHTCTHTCIHEKLESTHMHTREADLVHTCLCEQQQSPMDTCHRRHLCRPTLGIGTVCMPRLRHLCPPSRHRRLRRHLQCRRSRCVNMEIDMCARQVIDMCVARVVKCTTCVAHGVCGLVLEERAVPVKATAVKEEFVEEQPTIRLQASTIL